MLRSFPRSVRAAVLLASAAAAGVLLSAATPSPDFEDRVFAQLNRFRADPADYTKRLATYRIRGHPPWPIPPSAVPAAHPPYC